MSDHRKQPKPNPLDELENVWPKFTPKCTLTHSPQPSQSAIRALSIREESSASATAVFPHNSKSAPRRANDGEDSLKAGDTARAGMPHTAQSVTGSGGVGGSGGWGGYYGGHGGTGEGPSFTIRNSNVNLINPHATQLQSIKEKLANHVAALHKFTDQSKSFCAPGTRVKIQDDILEWLSPEASNREHIFWVTGIAGSGKSTLSATVVETLRQKPHTPVAAQFFISRNIPETIDPGKIIPTIALQLAEFSPAAAGIIHDVLERGFPPTRKEQVEELLLAPIRELSKSGNAVIILIDALDELEHAADSVKEILESIAPRGCDLPDNVRFLITSRPEHWAVISSWVNISGDRTLELAVFEQHALDTESSVNEVDKFIIARMKEITPRDWDHWPTPAQLSELSRKADGLFHYAVTTLHWIEDQIDEHGRACQSWVFNNLTQEGGLGQLEDLYKLVLASFENIDDPPRNEQRHRARLAGFQHVIGVIIVLDEPLTIHQIIALLADIPEDNFDVTKFLQRFRSVLIPGTTTSFEEATPQMHKSFRDYITDGHPPEEFRIPRSHAHFVTARSCLEVIVQAGSQSDVVLEYSVRHWYEHLRKAVEGGSVTYEDERMWNLLQHMMEEAIVDVWARTNLMDLFVAVAAVGWGLLKTRDKESQKY
ncbi:hypothetical protein C8F04DRAFT_1233385 [Mycena alexandri]|uniref:NACHT domain-containing protein n=1 Tax=Mycena alexandri TaxID=1745969 RepID=A0AAD6SXG2_9AGAR|nr:hypothetical protein C8F04DRAFT_1233385 [Mycena alexandri]